MQLLTHQALQQASKPVLLMGLPLLQRLLWLLLLRASQMRQQKLHLMRQTQTQQQLQVMRKALMRQCQSTPHSSKPLLPW